MRAVALAFALSLMAAAVGASGEIPEYRPRAAVSGIIRNWGNEEFQPLLKRWELGFLKYHPNIHFDDKMRGPASAMAGIYTGAADFSWMGHELLKEESMAFEWVFQYKALGIEVATSSLKAVHNSALAVFVQRDNPLDKITLTELDRIFSSEGGVPAYGYGPSSEGGYYFRRFVMKDKLKWASGVVLFDDEMQPDGRMRDAGPRILEALARDRAGIAVAKMRYANPRVKVLAVAVESGAPYYPPTDETVRSRQYPLSRPMKVYLNPNPKEGLDPKVSEFLRFILSHEGQDAVQQQGSYFPLAPPIAAAQLKKLEKLP